MAANQLVNLKGLSRCQQLTELYAGDNTINTMQGLKACSASLDVSAGVQGRQAGSLTG